MGACPRAVHFLITLISPLLNPGRVGSALLRALDYPTVVAWMSESSTALGLVVLVLAATWHSQLGMRVVVEDYVHANGPKIVTLIVLTFAHVLIAAAGVFAVLKAALGAAR